MNGELDPSLESVHAVHTSMAELLGSADVGGVYGEPVREGEVVIIPAAEVVTIGGFGLGYGSGQDGGDGGGEGGGGGGGGGKTFARPVAVVIAGPEGVWVEPVVDVTKIALAAVTAAGFMLTTLLRMTSRREALQRIKG